MKLTLPYPPSANVYWRVARNMIYVSAEAKAYKRAVLLAHCSQQPIRGPVRFTATIYRPRRVGDLMNREKVLCDALQGIAYIDDKQIIEAHFFLADSKENPRAEVTIEAIDTCPLLR